MRPTYGMCVHVCVRECVFVCVRVCVCVCVVEATLNRPGAW